MSGKAWPCGPGRSRIGKKIGAYLRTIGLCVAAAALYSGEGAFSPAAALPSFARQTGQPCGTCHTDFPALTPYGRRFKLLGYTTGGGPYRTTPFPSFGSNVDPLQDNSRLKTYVQGLDGKGSDPSAPPPESSRPWVPPLAAMAVMGYTHSQTAQVAPCGAYPCNDQVAAAPVSLFYGGAITDHIGAFAQLTYSGAPFGAPWNDTPSDPYATFQWGWDNTDVRYADTFNIAGNDVIFGITANNNPSVQDPWNTTPAWRFPYTASTTAPGPTASTLIDAALGPGHVVGVGGYAFINDFLYLELSGYRSVSFDAQKALGVDPYGAGMIDGIAPYWRIAIEPHWGNHWLMLGAYGMQANMRQWNSDQVDANGWQVPAYLPGSDRYTDTALDAQYQYRGDNFWFTLRGTWIHEFMQLDATFNNPNGAGSSNPSNTLDTLRIDGSIAYGNDNRVVFTTQYFNTKGSTDATLWALTSQFDSTATAQTDPNTDGFVFDLSYIPYISSHSPIWPWANARIGLQYTYYNRFDGDTTYAHDNNSLFAYLWFAM